MKERGKYITADVVVFSGDTSVRGAFEVRHAFESLGCVAVKIETVQDNINVNLVAPYDIKERLYKYYPEFYVDTTWAILNVDRNRLSKLPSRIIHKPVPLKVVVKGLVYHRKIKIFFIPSLTSQIQIKGKGKSTPKKSSKKSSSIVFFKPLKIKFKRRRSA